MCFFCVCLALTSAVFAESEASTEKHDWYFKPCENEKQPSIDPKVDFLRKYDAFYAGKSDEKVIYLTFDVGYDNGYLESILDTLKKENVPAAFFVTGAVFKNSTDAIRRMANEGHLVCNHTDKHPDMSKITDKAKFAAELDSLNEKYKEATGCDMPKFYRPPMGCYSEQSLKFAKELGYKTVFWSFAYVDWYNDKQPAPQEAIKKIMSRTHPGMVALLHSTSKTNAEILPQIIAMWRERGYSFATLNELCATD